MVKFVVRVFILDVNSWGRIFCVAWQIFDPEKVAWLYSNLFEARAKTMDALGRWVNSVNSKLDQIMGYETAFFMLLLPSLRSEYRSPSLALPLLLIGFQNFEASVKMLVWVFYPLGLDNQEFDQPLKENSKNGPTILSILNRSHNFVTPYSKPLKSLAWKRWRTQAIASHL